MLEYQRCLHCRDHLVEDWYSVKAKITELADNLDISRNDAAIKYFTDYHEDNHMIKERPK
jgi:hypothetical protein